MIYENDELSDAGDCGLDEDFDVSVPISMVRHASGDIDIVVVDLSRQDDSGCFDERRIRFSAQAAAQLIDSICASTDNPHILFGDERPAMATLH